MKYSDLSAAPTNSPPGDFIAYWRRAMFSTMQDVLDNFSSQQYTLIDARIPSQYNGNGTSSLAAKEGRIKGHFRMQNTTENACLGALSVPAIELLDERGALKSDKQIKGILNDAGVSSGRKYIVYCNTGLQVSPYLTVPFLELTLCYAIRSVLTFSLLFSVGFHRLLLTRTPRLYCAHVQRRLGRVLAPRPAAIRLDALIVLLLLRDASSLVEDTASERVLKVEVMLRLSLLGEAKQQGRVQ